MYTTYKPNADDWQLNVGCWIGTLRGRRFWALASNKGILHAQALAPTQTYGDAVTDVIGYLATELRMVGVDFYTNHAPLRELLTSGQLETLGIKLPHVMVLAPHQIPSGENLIGDAEAAALSIAADITPEFLLCATDGSRRHRKHGPNDTSSKGGYGWVAADGRFGWGSLETTSSALESELTALLRLLESIEAAQPVEVLIDSRDAIGRAADALGIEVSIPRRRRTPEEQAARTVRPGVATVLSRIAEHAGRDIKLTWTKGHVGTPLNEAADQMARLGREGLRLYGTRQRVSEVGKAMVERFLDEHTASPVQAAS